MDRLPLVPKCEQDHDVLPILTEVMQDLFRAPIYPINVAENFTKYKVEPDYSDLQASGPPVFEILLDLATQQDNITLVEEEILWNHAIAIIRKNADLRFYEELRLKSISVFQKLSSRAVDTYELIQRDDLLASSVELFLDFTNNPCLCTCAPHPQKTEQKPTLPVVQKQCKRIVLKPIKKVIPFSFEPNKVRFHNYQLGQLYKEKVKVRNITEKPQQFYCADFPKQSNFRLKMLTNSSYLAPGMCAEFLVTFQTQSYEDNTEFINFKTSTGEDLILAVTNSRDSPKLTCYVINCLLPLDAVKKTDRDSSCFSEKRCTALNFTIDCGTCLIGSYSLTTIIMKNEGQKGRFFIATEDEWCFTKLNAKSGCSYELTQGCFTIFPTLFEIDNGEIAQIFVLFVPETAEFHTEKFFVVCDNNSHQEMEVMGDCIAFSQKLLSVHMYLLEGTFRYCNRSININLAPFQTSAFVLSVTNNSPVYFTYYWALKYDADDTEENKKMDLDWIQISKNTRFLPSFSTTDVVVRLTAKTDKRDSYYIYLSLYLKNIPVGTAPGKRFVDNTGPLDIKHILFPLTNTEDDTSVTEDDTSVGTHLELVDMHMFELGIFCWVEPPTVPEVQELVAPREEEDDDALYQKLGISHGVLNFGLVPLGVQVTKSFHIKNLTYQELAWKLVEIYFKDKNFHTSSHSQRLSCVAGTLRGQSLCKITYTIETTECERWASIVVLFSYPLDDWHDFAMEDVCLAVYDVAETKMSIKTDNDMAVLCPKEFIYTGIPSYHTVYVHNAGELTGCFYFLKAKGNDSDKVRLRLKPQSGVVPPGAIAEIKVELTALESGIFEDIHVPCFIGDPEKLISLRVLCSASTINVQFCLPNKDEGYDKYLWPPKEEMPTWNYDTVGGETQSFNGEDGVWGYDQGTLHMRNPIDEIFLEIVTSDSVAATYPITKTNQVHVKQATKLSFYIENLTPIEGHFTVNPTNYGPESDCINHILVKAKARKPEFFWDKACLHGDGIVVEPKCRTGDILPYEVIEIDLWIYANTWGKYLEEIIVEVNDLTPFCFNLVIEVQGLPVEFPFARNTILPCPTLRFENIAYSTDRSIKRFTVTNISAVPVQITWHIFCNDHHSEVSAPFNFLLEFNEDDFELLVAKDFYGCEACSKCVRVTPCVLVIDKQSTVTVTVLVSPTGYVASSKKTHIKYELIGFVGVKNCHKFKANYFKRDTGHSLKPARIEVLVTIELPVMQIEMFSDETTTDVFVNDILLNGYKIPEVYLILRNVDKTPIYFHIEIDKPFEIIEARTVPSGITNTKNLILLRDECLQIKVGCSFSQQELFQFAELIYTHKERENDQPENYISVIAKDLNVYQTGALRQMINFTVRLHFPYIEVKPNFIKFGYNLLYRSKKNIFTIFNMTASPVKFEIFKTAKCEDYEVYPNHGDIPGSTGVNKQFVDIAVYFTPKHCKIYMESLRIMTNIPQYYIDVPVGGQGSIDEKFYD